MNDKRKYFEIHLRFFSSCFLSDDLFVWVCVDEFSPYMGRRTSSSLSLSNGSASPRAEASGSQSVPQRKRLLKAPSLAELDSSDSDVSMSLCARGRSSEVLSGVSEQMMIEVLVCSIQDEVVGLRSASSSSVATSLMDDTSPESAVGKKSESQLSETTG